MTEFNLQLDLWISSGRALEYFKKRDPNAISPLKEIYAAMTPPSKPKQIES